MSADFKETIFDPFTRAENSVTNKVQGTGLGMAITKNLVEARRRRWNSKSAAALP
jgi:signal transduction histidine kinase